MRRRRFFESNYEELLKTWHSLAQFLYLAFFGPVLIPGILWPSSYVKISVAPKKSGTSKFRGPQKNCGALKNAGLQKSAGPWEIALLNTALYIHMCTDIHIRIQI